MSLIQLIVERGPEAADAKLKGLMKTEAAVAETIENNVRKLIIKVISGKSHTSQAGLIRMSHLGRAGLRFSRASTDCIATFDSEMPLS